MSKNEPRFFSLLCNAKPKIWLCVLSRVYTVEFKYFNYNSSLQFRICENSLSIFMCVCVCVGGGGGGWVHLIIIREDLTRFHLNPLPPLPTGVTL